MPSKYVINFPLERDKSGCLPSLFSYANIFRENWKFVTNFYRKKTFSRVYTNFKSFIPEKKSISISDKSFYDLCLCLLRRKRICQKPQFQQLFARYRNTMEHMFWFF